MFTAKIPLKDAEKIKKFIVSNKLHDKTLSFEKENGFLYIGIKDKDSKKKITSKFSDLKFVSKKLSEKESEGGKLRDSLSDVLDKSEMLHLKTSFDTVGDIAILEIDEELRKKEKIIAKKLLELNKNIKVVVRKEGIHSGTFRTQKVVVVAGENRKETFHKENNVSIKLNVEDVYFSPRLSTERKRIASLVNPDEDILVMFSGSAPYPCVLAKNTKARHVFGVEINPKGHLYGMENIKLNHLHNVVLINGDVNKIVPNFYHYIVGLKSSDVEKQLNTRLKHHPTIMELHLFNSDLFDGKEVLEKTIVDLQNKGINVILHMPFSKPDKHENYSLAQIDIKDELKMFKILGNLCKKYHIKAVVHPILPIGIAEDEDMLVDHIKKLENYYNFFYFENSSLGLFSKAEDIVRIGKKAGVKNMCIDTAHLFITYQNNDLIEKHIRLVQQNFKTYFHLSDHDYKTHTCEIGKGRIDFSRVLSYVNQGVIEIRNKDEMKPTATIKSFHKVEHTPRTFDRILMPLPKSAEDFLDTALLVSKKGTIIHFYDFLNESEFDLAREKVKKACERNRKKYKIFNLVKCGQHAPRVFRICLDVEIL